jgi:predicted unusual protein kinase regulating ubiquinone biosynthesis (AarF/ABC1/UbiB family)
MTADEPDLETADPTGQAADSGENRVPTSGFSRGARMLGLPLGYAGRATVGLGRRLIGHSAESVQNDMRQQAAAQMFRVLGELKGGAMKFGQALSMFEAVLPDEIAGPYRDQLRRLQDSAPPMPVARLEAVLEAELGADWRDLFSDFGRRPAAAASIGQVHRATWAATGEPVAVKIQYPGADAALESDLAQIGRLASVMSPLTGSVDVKALTAEIADRIREEVDYLKEAEHQSIAAAAYAGDTEFAVPSVLTATRRVLVSQWLQGSKLNAVAEWDEERRNAVGLSYVRFLFSAPHRAGLLHADPHPGNFLVLEDGRLGIVDWGLVARLPEGLPEPMGRLIRTALHGNAAEVAAGLRKEGLLVGDVDPQDVMTLLSPFIEPAAAAEFHFTRDWMRSEYQRLAAEGHSSETVMNKLNVPPVYALIHRVWMGGIAVLSQLDVRAAFSDVLTEYLPGFAAR